METQHPTQSTRSVLNDWVGHRVTIKYLGGPVEPFDPNDVKGLSREDQVEVRSGIFQLHRVGYLGVEVSNDVNDALIDRVTLIPWGALLSIRGTAPDERGGPEGRLSKEEVAELGLRGAAGDHSRGDLPASAGYTPVALGPLGRDRSGRCGLRPGP